MSGEFIEDELDKKFDRCMSDALLKFGGGLLLGSFFAVLFFKGKRWPILTGAGFGIGMAYTNCERDVNATLRKSTI